MRPRPRRARQAALIAVAIAAVLGVAALPLGGSAAAQSALPAPAPAVQECRVPLLVGLTLVDASSRLRATGCGYVLRLNTRATGDARVTKQSPPAGSLAPAGSSVAVFVSASPTGGGGGGVQDYGLCGPPDPGVKCGPGRNRKSAGGGDKVPHNDGAGRDWPALTGILWQVFDSEDRHRVGGPATDELNGHHGDERLEGGPGHDILWGDWDPKGNTTRQRDVLIGGSGNDWIYPSHGRTTVRGGPGRDYIYAFYGKGKIDCGAGIDVARVRQTKAFKLRNCEIVKHFCAHGDDGNGGCNKKGAGKAARRR